MVDEQLQASLVETLCRSMEANKPQPAPDGKSSIQLSAKGEPSEGDVMHPGYMDAAER